MIFLDITQCFEIAVFIRLIKKARWHYGFRDRILIQCVLHVLLKFQAISIGEKYKIDKDLNFMKLLRSTCYF